MDTQSLTLLEYALLGLVSMAPMSGYDVHKMFATTPLGHFSSSPGAIYPALRRLERRDLLKATLDSTTETRPRRVYSLTEAGQAALDAWLHQQVMREELVSNSGAPILRFGFAGGRLSPDEVIAYLDGWRQTTEAYLEELRGYRGLIDASAAPHARLSLEHGIRGYEGVVEWIQDAIAEIRSHSRRAKARGGRRAPRQ